MSVAETGMNERPGCHPGGHVWMGLHCEAEPDKHERTGGKGQRASWPFQSCESIINLPLADSSPSSSLPNLPGGQSSAVSAHWTCLQKLCRDGFQWNTEALAMDDTSKRGF